MSSQRSASVFVHPTACVDEGAQLGEGTKVWHFSHVMPGAVVGRGCILGQNVFVASGVRIGDGCKLQNNVSVYQGVVLEDEVFCGPSVVFTNVLTPRAHVPRNDERFFSPTRIRRRASLGANATIICGVCVGEYAMVGAGAVVSREVLPHALVLGVPARLAGWVCACGAVLAFDDDQARCLECGSRYQLQTQDEHPRLLPA